MMNWQEITVIAAVGGAIVYILWRIIAFFKKVSKNETPCDSCDADCSLRDIKRKQHFKNSDCPKEK